MLAITKPQLIKVNKAINDYRHLRHINTLLYKEIDILDSLGRCKDNQLLKQTSIILRQDSILLHTQGLHNMEMQIQKDLLKKTKKRSRNLAIGVGVGGTLLGVILGVLLIK